MLVREVIIISYGNNLTNSSPTIIDVEVGLPPQYGAYIYVVANQDNNILREEIKQRLPANEGSRIFIVSDKATSAFEKLFKELFLNKEFVDGKISKNIYEIIEKKVPDIKLDRDNIRILRAEQENTSVVKESLSPLSEESNQEEIALAMRILSTIKKLPLVIAILTSVLIAFFVSILGDIETLKQQQIPMMLTKAQKGDTQYWCERARLIKKTELAEPVCKAIPPKEIPTAPENKKNNLDNNNVPPQTAKNSILQDRLAKTKNLLETFKKNFRYTLRLMETANEKGLNELSKELDQGEFDLSQLYVVENQNKQTIVVFYKVFKQYSDCSTEKNKVTEFLSIKENDPFCSNLEFLPDN